MTNSIYQPITLNDPRLLQFAEQLNPGASPIYLPVIDKPGPEGNAYWNVSTAIEQVGGKMLLGWEINYWPGCFLVATHHAALQAEDGGVYDVTQRSQAAAVPTVNLFVPDDSIAIDLNKTPAVKSRFYILHSAAQITDYLRAYDNLNAFEKKLSDKLYDIGYRCETNKALASGVVGATPAFTEGSSVDIDEIKMNISELSWILKDKIKKLKQYSDALQVQPLH
ncbi:hypothetical protein [Klebsiella aerogenes]|uniref:hypothetical protein n=1 Tax=Klebsiella aerogenes TaxID=548 RepID=UPI0022AE2B0E|nr:hypothetical protein [Klebsiella aerogenes]WPS00926.1 hypothetical protein SM790_11480 [Klebsiella aerogenes]WPS40257.1 hypothetical protein SM910_11735 [Klebsiella aerogenes]HCR0216091.1 hypothetical protein [Klebsiella aerogenes]HCR0957768.1 hypothetical protein [Klebsiella aerogenes]HCT6902391.1 hypothetical protein [Klebsiella aerogenes]